MRAAQLEEVARGVEIAHATRPATGRVEHDVAHVALGSDLAAAGAERVAQRCDGIALRVDRAAIVRAETAVVTGRTAVVLDAVDARRRAVRVVAEMLGRVAREDRAVHVGPGRHRVRIRAPRRERVRARFPGDADELLGRRVVRLHLVVAERPVDEVATVDRAELGHESEVDLAEAGSLASAWKPAPPRPDGMLLTSPTWMRSPSETEWRNVRGSTRGSGPRKCRRACLISSFDRCAAQRERLLEIEQVVRALLEHDHRPTGLGEHVGCRRPGRTRPDDHRVAVEVGHRRAASGASERPCSLPSRVMEGELASLTIMTVH